MKLISFYVLLLALLGCSSQDRQPAQFQSTDEVLVNIGVPLRTIEREVQKLADSSPIIKKIDFIKLDPQTRMLSVKGTLKYSLEGLFNFGVPLPKDAPTNHTFEFAVSFPTAKELSQIRYFRLKFHRFRLNGVDYMNAFSIVASFVQTIMANSDLIHYVYDQAGAQIKNPDAMTMMKEIIESNGFVVNQTTQTIAIKLNLNYFSQFKMYDEIKDLRLWYFGPDLLGGTQNYTVFRLVAGISKPSDFWVNRHIADLDRDNKTLEEVKASLHAQYSNHEQATRDLSDFFYRLLASERIVVSNLPLNYQREISSFISHLGASARDTLSIKNELFVADPETEYLNFIDMQQGRSRAFFSDIDRRLTIDQLIKGGADPNNKDLPIVTKRLGQDILNSAMNFVRDVEVDGQYFIKEAHTIIAPHLPGFIIRGRINVDLNYLLGQMNSGFLGKKVNASASIDPDWIPFEMVLETKMGNGGWLGLDPKSIRLFDGNRRLAFDRTSQNHQFFLDFVKLYLVQTLAALNFDTTENTEPTEQKRARKLKELGDYLKSIQTSYGTVSGRGTPDDVLKAMNFDILKNPFSTAGPDYVKKKGQILFSDLINYDANQRMFRIKLDPRVVLDNIEGPGHTLQIWNLGMFNSKEFNNTFLEVSVGDGPRGRRYLDSVIQRERDIDNAGFSGLYNDHERSAVDLLTSINFHYLENYVNGLLQGMIKIQNAAYEAELKEDKEQSHTLLENVTIHVGQNRRISLNLKATVVSKKKRLMRWMYGDQFKVDKDSYSISAEVDLHSRNLAQIRNQLRQDRLPIYFSNEAIGVTLNRVKLEFGKPSLVNSALSKLTNLNLESPLGTKFRSLIVKIVSAYFNSQYKARPGHNLVGHDIEEMVKVLTTREEIILLLNPRLSGPAFELKLSGKDKFIEHAMRIDTANKEVHLAFTGSAAMAKLDKRELIDLARNSEVMIAPFLRINNGAALARELNTSLFVDRAILASDKSKLSLYNRLLATMRNYDQVLNVVTIPFPNKNAEQRITSCGVELMYFAGASFILHQHLDNLINKINTLKVQGSVRHYNSLVEARDKLRRNIMDELVKKYRTSHHARNVELIKNPNTFWTYQFYADAFFAEKVFDNLKR